MSILQRLACDPDNCEEIAEDATYITTKTIGLISYVINKENSGGSQKKLVLLLRSSLNFVMWFTISGGKIGARFRQELLENPFFLNCLERILNRRDCQPELWEPVMDTIALLALDEAARQEIGSTQSIISNLIDAFLKPDDRLQRIAAGRALGILTIMSTDNCWAILLADPELNLINNLISMLEDEYSADILHNLCANSRDKLMDIDLRSSVLRESALPKVSISITVVRN